MSDELASRSEQFFFDGKHRSQIQTRMSFESEEKTQIEESAITLGLA